MADVEYEDSTFPRNVGVPFSHLCIVISEKYSSTLLWKKEPYASLLPSKYPTGKMVLWALSLSLAFYIYPAHLIFLYLIKLMAVNENNKPWNPLSYNFCVYIFPFKYYQNFCTHYIKENVMLRLIMSLRPCCTVLSGKYQKSPGKNPSHIWIGKRALKLLYINT